MEEYFYSRKKKSRVWTRVLFIYIFLILMRLLFLEYGFRIVSVDNTDFELLKKYENSKLLVLSSPYVLSFFSLLNFQRKPTARQNDLVLLHSFEYKNMGTFSRIVYYTLDSLSLGIVKTKRIYTIQKIAFLPNQRFQFTSKKLLSRTEFDVDSLEDSEQKIESVPFFDDLQDAYLQDDEVFLVGTREYEFDSRLLGAVKLRAIKGRVLFVLDPYWETVAEL